MLRLKVRLERADGKRSVETIGVASSGFTGLTPEILIPASIAGTLKLHEVGKPESHVKVTADGRIIEFLKYRNTVKVYLIAEDRVEGPVLCSVLVTPYSRYVLLNDKLLSKLRIVLLDFGEGIWCFRDELGRRERKSI